MLDSRFLQSKADYSPFMKGHGGTFVAVLVYVDDIIIACLNKCIVYEVKALLHSKFKMKNLGSLKYFLRLEIARFTTEVVVCQRQYTL